MGMKKDIILSLFAGGYLTHITLGPPHPYEASNLTEKNSINPHFSVFGHL